MKKSEIREAVARGWCHANTEHLEMNADLAEAIVEEIEIALIKDGSGYTGE